MLLLGKDLNLVHQQCHSLDSNGINKLDIVFLIKQIEERLEIQLGSEWRVNVVILV